MTMLKRMFACALSIYLCVFTQILFSADWEFRGERDGVSLYWRTFPNSSLPEFKAQTTIATPMATVLGVLLDVEACPQWVHQCKKAFVVDQPQADQQIIYQVNSVPLAKDRDLLMVAQLKYTGEADEVTISIGNASHYCDNRELPICDEIRKSKFVRIEQLSGSYKLRKIDKQSVEVTWQQHLELGGNLPGWIVRGKLDDLAYDTLYQLRQQVRKPAYQKLKLVIENNQLILVSEQ
jgi:hypothetical protein